MSPAQPTQLDAAQVRRSRPRRENGVSAPSNEELTELILSAWNDCRRAVEAGNKDLIRHLHVQAKAHDAEVSYPELRKDLSKLKHYFAEPKSIDPTRIRPILVPISGQRSLEARLFKVARGYWSMPYSKGYGRRLRFIVLDQYHEAVIGIIGLQSPSADLRCRDDYFGLQRSEKLRAVNNTLDAYTVGATPTYAPLLGGKLVAGLLRSQVIRQAYWREYGGKKTTQLNLSIPQPLLGITTASAFGRSSIYSRLQFEGKLLAKSIGYTRGFGTLQFEGIYPAIVAWLKANNRHVPAGFGNGPRVRWQNIMRALGDLGISKECLAHGVRREVFLFELATNLVDVLRSNALPEMSVFDDDTWGEYWKARWCLPRAKRYPDWAEFSALEKMQSALNVAPSTNQL